MDIKLKAKLSAYAQVETFELKDSEHTCNKLRPISKEQIDALFGDSVTESPDVSTIDTNFANFVESLFQEDS